MNNKKTSQRKLARMLIALLCCFPVFVVTASLLDGANDWLILLINLVIGGTILLITYVVGDNLDMKREQLHREHLEEIEERKRLEKLTRRNHSGTEDNE